MRDWEAGYRDGQQQVARDLLRIAGRLLPEGPGKEWSLERAEVVAKLREMSQEYGCNDWEDDLHLADVLEKYLWPALPREPDPVFE